MPGEFILPISDRSGASGQRESFTNPRLSKPGSSGIPGQTCFGIVDMAGKRSRRSPATALRAEISALSSVRPGPFRHAGQGIMSGRCITVPDRRNPVSESKPLP